jgi:YbbR domain-containing protein
VPIKVELTKYLTEEDTPNIALGSVDTLIVSLEDIATKQFKVTVVKKGTVEDGYTIGDLKAKPNIVQVSGAASQIDKIDQLRVEIDVSNESEDFTTTGVPKVYDADGREINSTNMTFGVSEVKVTGTLLNTKTVPLNIEVTGEPVDGYQYISTDYEPKSIVVAGDESDLAKISAVTIPFDIEGKYSDVESEVNLADYIPKGIELTEDSQTVMVNVKIQKLQSKVFTFSVKNVQVKNLSDSMVFNFDPSTSSDDITVRVLGLEEDLDKLTINDLNPYIDLKGMNKEGTQVVEIQFQNVEGIRIQNKPTVNIELAKIMAEDENTPGNEPNETNPTNDTDPNQGDTGVENQDSTVNTEDENTDEAISDINGNE